MKRPAATALRAPAKPASFAVFASLLLAGAPARAADAPWHQAGDDCPRCASGGPVGPDGFPLGGSGHAPPAARPGFPKIEPEADGVLRIGFEHLASFAFDPPAAKTPPRPGAAERVPPEVRALDGKRVVLPGFMLPTKMDGPLVKEFFIVRSQLACCFGVMPAANEWVLVRVAGQGIRVEKDVPLRFAGTLRVGEIYDEGAFVALYRMELEKVAGGPER